MDLTGGPEASAQGEAEWRPPKDVVPEEYHGYFDTGNRFVVREAWDGPQLADFSITLQIRVEEEWIDVVRCDCAHDTVHAHYFSPDGSQKYRKELMPVTSFEAVREGYELAYSMIVDRWEEHVRGFLAQ